ncbi:protein of unknown function [Pseudomonas asplenii]|uniref:DUF4276 family protein n=1 Tax=Pseudomonas asplenii TaxID=53407 RepID=A0A1H1ZND1_9PSED|nr:DUF4276 family protein [Pseudomonas asplenii]SDT35228.1 protein of unknown function [Pseudomonas asplenii]
MKLYVEGGGSAASLRTACREGFSKLLDKAGFKGRMPRIVACGSRNDAYDSFCTAIRNGEKAMLLIDSEAPVIAAAQPGDAREIADRANWLPWQHLLQRQGDGWKKPEGSEDWQCQLMVQCMESWLLADRQVLREFFGQGYQENKLPALGNSLERVAKERVYDAFAEATRNCKSKDQYGKGEHSFKLLALIDPAKVSEASPWAKRFFEVLEKRM